MKKYTLLLILFSCIAFACNTKSPQTLTVLQFNIWQEGEMIEGGFDAVVNEIVASNADFVMLSEVRNYNNTRFCDRITQALKEKGETYYSFLSYDSGLLSKYPIIDSTTVYPLKDDAGSMYRLVAKLPSGVEVAAYTAHLDYRSCAYYDVRGYNGSTWEKQTPVTNVDSILKINRDSKRDDAIRSFIEVASIDKKAGRFIILGGDFNEPSHLDWTKETAHLMEHKGLVVPWDVSVLLTKEGYIDTYRAIYPDPVNYPGVTFPSDNALVPLDKLTWAPDSDERERIDFIYYYPHKSFKLTNSWIVGPKGSIAYNKRVLHTYKDSIVEPITIWPTDHQAVISTFEY